MAPAILSLSPFPRGTVAILRPRDGFQIQYSSTRSTDLLGFDLFQLFSVLLTHGSNASQMYQAEWLDRLTSGKEQRLRKSKSEKRKKKKVKQRWKKNLKCEGVTKPGCSPLLFDTVRVCKCAYLKNKKQKKQWRHWRYSVRVVVVSSKNHDENNRISSFFLVLQLKLKQGSQLFKIGFILFCFCLDFSV